MIKRYCTGFAFDLAQNNVLLINKNKPDWQKGHLNGVGGKVEDGEEFPDAMAREFQEEAGIWVPPTRWHNTAIIYKPNDYTCYFYRCFLTYEESSQVMSMTDEALQWVPKTKLPLNVIYNLNWLIPMSLDLVNYPIMVAVP
jgi:8-oxo-dGTP diphosphatase